jgi:hypothetical protein
MNDQLHLQALQGVVQALNAVNQTLAARASQVPVGAFSALPAVPVQGMLAGVTDSNTATWGATIAGGGTNHVLGYFNGLNWTVASK